MLSATVTAILEHGDLVGGVTTMVAVVAYQLGHFLRERQRDRTLLALSRRRPDDNITAEPGRIIISKPDTTPPTQTLPPSDED